MPRFISSGFMPAARPWRPSRTIAWARTVSVVVAVAGQVVGLGSDFAHHLAASFSNLSASSISFVRTLTPSLVMRGRANDFV